MFNFIKKKIIEKRVKDEILYEYVYEEMEKGIKIKGLWAKAFAHSQGDELKTNALYMKDRVQSIKDYLTSLKIVYEEMPKEKLVKYINNNEIKEENLNHKDKEELKKNTYFTYKIKKVHKEMMKSKVVERELTKEEEEFLCCKHNIINPNSPFVRISMHTIAVNLNNDYFEVYDSCADGYM